jgi:50S ribosome-binding GTPase
MSTTIALGLVSHTNVGKTTLARTLLGRDIGEVRDEAHVTQVAEPHTLIETPEGDRLQLWDTPGFGDSQRLARRLAQAGNPIGWFMGQVWDRWRDRAFWLNQHALRHVLDQAEVVLYLVNASEAPADAAYLDPELEVLGLIGKPVLVLLNQLGEPRPPAEEAAELARWRERLHRHGCVRELLAFDAFARCWVSEAVLLRAVGACLAPERQPVLAGLARLRQQQQLTTWQAAMALLAERLARAAVDRQQIDAAGLGGRLRELGAALGWRREGSADTPKEAAMQALAGRLDADIRRNTERLISLHGLDGRAGQRVLALLAEHFAAQRPLDEGQAAVLGGLLSGALAGLKADFATGGLTMGGGLLAGGVLGALGAAGLARGYNLLRGSGPPSLAWTDQVLDDLTEAALLGYLAVAHHGRGRGEWAEGEHPAFWVAEVQAVLAPRRTAFHAAWAAGREAAVDQAALQSRLTPLLGEAGAALLKALYPALPQQDLPAGAPDRAR